MNNKSEDITEMTIERLKELAGISTSPPKAIVLLPEEFFIQEMTEVGKISVLLEKLKEIDGSIGENWTEVNIGDVQYRATAIIKNNPTNS